MVPVTLLRLGHSASLLLEGQRYVTVTFWYIAFCIEIIIDRISQEREVSVKKIISLGERRMILRLLLLMLLSVFVVTEKMETKNRH